jgi:hypothetical protein
MASRMPSAEARVAVVAVKLEDEARAALEAALLAPFEEAPVVPQAARIKAAAEAKVKTEINFFAFMMNRSLFITIIA